MIIDSDFVKELYNRDNYDLPAGAIATYFMLRSYMDEDTKTATLSCTRMAKERNATYGGIYTHIKKLMDAGLVECVGKDIWKRNIYRFPLEFV